MNILNNRDHPLASPPADHNITPFMFLWVEWIVFRMMYAPSWLPKTPDGQTTYGAQLEIIKHRAAQLEAIGTAVSNWSHSPKRSKLVTFLVDRTFFRAMAWVLRRLIKRVGKLKELRNAEQT